MFIRNAQESDFTSCVRIAENAWPEFKERASIYHIFCKFFSNTCFVCEHNGKIQAFLLGFISQVDSSQSYIHLVAVDPPAQRQGLANQLYQMFFKTVSKSGVRQVRLIINPENRVSIAFHKKLGFQAELRGDTIQVDGVMAVKDYNGRGLHMVPFSRSVP